MRVATFQNMSCVLSTMFYQKGGNPLVLNLSFKDMGYGKANNENTDLCYPIIVEGIGDDGIPYGITPKRETGRLGISFFNYDYTFKTEDFVKKEFARFSRARHRYFGTWDWGSTEEASFNVFLNMMRGRLRQCVYKIPWQNQPKYIRDKIRDIRPEQFGHSGWGKL